MSKVESPAGPRGPLPPALFLATLAAMVLLRLFLPLASFAPNLAMRLVGVSLLLVGLLVNVLLDARFKRAGTTIKPFAEPSAFFIEGLYRYSRNPMYLAMGLALVGVVLILGALSPWLAVAAFLIVMDRHFIPAEEARLAARFGEDYARYRARVRRWI
jgi:protein-S-isoprenylcysteine O-methyltransferase Ste14